MGVAMDDRWDTPFGVGGRPEQTTTNRLEPFTNGLPSTMQVAHRFLDEVVHRLGPLRREWPFEDRVLVWLLPNMDQECLAFHNGAGGDLASHFIKHQLESIDMGLAAELLRRLNR
jgi:hypothetical protein